MPAWRPNGRCCISRHYGTPWNSSVLLHSQLSDELLQASWRVTRSSGTLALERGGERAGETTISEAGIYRILLDIEGRTQTSPSLAVR